MLGSPSITLAAGLPERALPAAGQAGLDAFVVVQTCL